MSEPSFDNSALRVVIKDLDTFGKADDLNKGVVQLVIDTPENIDTLLSNPSMIGQRILKNNEDMAKDTSYKSELSQIQSQVISKKDTYYLKLYGLALAPQSDIDLAIFSKKGELIFRTELGPLLDDYAMKELDTGGLILKIQNNLKVLIVGSRKQIKNELDGNYVARAKYDKSAEAERLEKLKSEGPLRHMMEMDSVKRIADTAKLVPGNETANMLMYEYSKTGKGYTAASLLDTYFKFMNYRFEEWVKTKGTGDLPQLTTANRQAIELFMKKVIEAEGTDLKKNFRNQNSIDQLLKVYAEARIDQSSNDDMYNHFNGDAKLTDIFLAEYSANDVNWFFKSDDTEKRLSIFLPETNLKQAIFQAIQTDFVFDLFQHIPLRVISNNLDCLSR
jgi:hypothetical protein